MTEIKIKGRLAAVEVQSLRNYEAELQAMDRPMSVTEAYGTVPILRRDYLDLLTHAVENLRSRAVRQAGSLP